MMRVVLMGVGGYMVVAGALLLFRPQLLMRFFEPLRSGQGLRGWAAVALAFGLLMLWAAPVSRASGLIQVLGALGVVKGLYLFAAPSAQVGRLMSWWLGLPPIALRVWGLLAMGLGAALLV